MEKLEKNAIAFSLMVDDLDYYDRKLLPSVKIILDRKLKKNDNVICLVKFCEYFSVTELTARKLIYKIELDEYYGKQFIFINGDEDYKSYDEIRKTKVLQAAKSKNP